MIGAANRDRRRWPDADELRLDRPDPRPISFGFGVHHRLGAALARMELRTALPPLLDRLGDDTVDPARTTWKRSFPLRGPDLAAADPRPQQNVSEPEPYYPAWLGRGLLDETIRGVPGVGTTFEGFLDAYTLHDSIWIALVVHPGHADLIVRLDAHWSQGRVPYPGPVVAAWPILVVTMEGSVEARSDGLMSGHIASAASGPHPDDDRLARTTLEGDGGSVELVHRRAVQLRCFARDGAALAIPLG